MKILTNIMNTRTPQIAMTIVLITSIVVGLLDLSSRPLFAKGVAGYSMDTTTPSDEEAEKKKKEEEDRKIEADKRLIHDQQEQQRVQKEKEEEKKKDEQKKKDEERHEQERREREAREAREREERERERERREQRDREEATRIAEQQQQEQDRLYREEQQRLEQERAYREQQSRIEQEQRDRIAYEEQQRRDQEIRDAEERQRQLDSQPATQGNEQSPADDNGLLTPSEPAEPVQDSANDARSEALNAFYFHYRDSFFYPYDLYSFAHFPFDKSGYSITQPQITQKLPSWIRKGSANEAIHDICFGWKYKSIKHLIRHTTRRSVVKVLYNGRPSHSLTQNEFYELTNEAFLNMTTYGMKIASIKAKPTSASFKLTHQFYTSDMKAREVAVTCGMRKINGVWLFEQIDIARDVKR